MKLTHSTSTSPRSFVALLALGLGFALCVSCSADTAETPAMMASGGTTNVAGSTAGGAGGAAAGQANGSSGGGAGGAATGGGGAGGAAAGAGGASGGAGGASGGAGGASGGASGGGAGGASGGASGGGAGGASGGASGGGGGGAGGQVNASEDCMTVCGGIVNRCPDFDYYPDMNTCLADCAANEQDWCMDCRKMHLMNLPADNNAVHCPHVNGEGDCAPGTAANCPAL